MIFYKYFLKIGELAEFECHPINEVTFSWENVDGEAYKEIKVSEVIFGCLPNAFAPQQSDFHSIMYYPSCTEIILYIRSYTTNFTTNFASFIFSKNIAKVNLFEKTISVTPRCDNNYTKLKGIENKEINILDGTDTRSINSLIDWVFEYKSFPSNGELLAAPGWEPIYSGSSFGLRFRFYCDLKSNFYEKAEDTYPNQYVAGWSVLNPGLDLTFTSVYDANDYPDVSLVPNPGDNYSLLMYDKLYDFYGGLYYTLGYWMDRSTYFTIQSPITFPKGVTLVSIIDKFLTEAGISGSFVNTSFGDSAFQYLTFLQMSDFKNPLAVQNATIANITWSDFISDIKTIFNAKYFFDGYFFRIECEEYFTNTEIIDLRNILDKDGNSYAANSYSYEVINEDFPQKEEFSFVESYSQDNKGLPILYEGICVGKDAEIKTYATDKIITDAYGITQAAEKFSDDNIIMLCLYNSGEIIRDTGDLSGLNLINNHLAWANLHQRFYKYGRPLVNFNINAAEQTAISLKKTKRVEVIEIPFCAVADENGTLDVVKRYLTFWNETQEYDYQVGNLYRASLNLSTNMLSLELIYTNTFDGE